MGTIRLSPSSLASFVKTLSIVCALVLSQVSLGQIAQRGASTTSTAGTTTTSNISSLSISKPSGVVAGDLLIVSILQNESDNDNGGLANASATGWTLIDGRIIFSAGTGNGNNAWHGTILYRIADGTEGASISFNLTSPAKADMAIGSMAAFSGVTSTNGVKADGTSGGPFDIDPGTLNVSAAATTTASAPSVTSASAGSAVLMLAFCNDNNTHGSWSATNPASLNEIFDNGTSSVDRGAVAGAFAIRGAAGSTGNGSATVSASDYTAAMFVVLKTCLPSISVLSAPSAFCPGDVYNPSTPTVTNNGSAITSQGWQIETSAGSNSFVALSVPYTVSSADNGKDIRYAATNACGTTYTSIVTLSVNAANGITLSSAAGTDNQQTCQNGSITPITYNITGATSASVAGLPSGVSGNLSSGVFTISGTPSVGGSFNYTITLSGGCPGGTNTASGSMTVNSASTVYSHNFSG